MKVVVGGTFSHLHKGHKTLLKKAFNHGDHVIIGITSNKMCQNKHGEIQDYKTRKKQLKKYIETISQNTEYQITKIEDKVGVSLQKNLDAIIVSPETRKNAIEINKKRIEKGNKPLKIIEIPLQTAEDGKPISSTRIRKGQIDRDGNLKKQTK
ncbi:Phosphopantetheine adenylyltransferase CAB4 [Methanonatronarchaeum thermophilum]|uniref:Phosphopantetheine adenylyltransferase n=1 Tax=Methanonatronarchaeum thermophilum TaxID=1927129 RepID=A0A1Y3GCK8_9EURY|nr:phosphopantetheine adenylyltransferase [Methanonatronarchaeum thermophilum]OUJ19139.1 Phosphopantetheine adenylyltransferase CAB4 [Methanonatronarchaeum thermophilum]